MPNFWNGFAQTFNPQQAIQPILSKWEIDYKTKQADAIKQAEEDRKKQEADAVSQKENDAFSKLLTHWKTTQDVKSGTAMGDVVKSILTDQDYFQIKAQLNPQQRMAIDDYEKTVNPPQKDYQVDPTSGKLFRTTKTGDVEWREGDPDLARPKEILKKEVDNKGKTRIIIVEENPRNPNQPTERIIDTTIPYEAPKKGGSGDGTSKSTGALDDPNKQGTIFSDILDKMTSIEDERKNIVAPNTIVSQSKKDEIALDKKQVMAKYYDVNTTIMHYASDRQKKVINELEGKIKKTLGWDDQKLDNVANYGDNQTKNKVLKIIDEYIQADDKKTDEENYVYRNYFITKYNIFDYDYQ